MFVLTRIIKPKDAGWCLWLMSHKSSASSAHQTAAWRQTSEAICVESAAGRAGLFSPFCYFSCWCWEREDKGSAAMPCFRRKTKTWCLRVVLKETGKAHCGTKKINKKIYCKTNQAVLPEPVLSSWRQIFSQILKALAWDRPSFVLCCLWIYFPNTVEFFAFLKTGDPSADTNCFFSSPHWPKSVRIIVFLCKQRIEVNNRSAFTLPGPASAVFSHSFFPFFLGGGSFLIRRSRVVYDRKYQVPANLSAHQRPCIPTGAPLIRIWLVLVVSVFLRFSAQQLAQMRQGCRSGSACWSKHHHLTEN